MGRTVVHGALLVAALAGVSCSPGDPKPGSSTRVDASAPGTMWTPPPVDRDACLALDDGSYVRLDEDHDGVDGWWFVQCGVSEQIDLDLSGAPDCDDTDPTVSHKAWRDADGDGVGAAKTECFATVPPGYLTYRSRPADCDDADPELFQRAYGDHDGDGYGDPNDLHCIGALVPKGMTLDGTDCDDADPARAPYHAEAWADGVDSNCDGIDDPLDCNRGDCGCELASTQPVAIDSSCAGVDLVFVALVTCSYCSGYNTVEIANRGTSALTGGFDIVVAPVDGVPAEAARDGGTRDGGARGIVGDTVHVAEDLGPGAVTHPLLLFPTGSAHLVTSAAECNRANNDFVLPDHNGICDP